MPRSYADGATPLHEACREGHIDLARELLMAAATYAHKTSGVHRKSKSASRNGGVGGSNGLAHSKFSDDNLFGPNPLDYRGNTPLHDACREGHADICSDLLAAGADQTIVNENGKEAYKLIHHIHRCTSDDFTRAPSVLKLVECVPCLNARLLRRGAH